MGSLGDQLAKFKSNRRYLHLPCPDSIHIRPNLVIIRTTTGGCPYILAYGEMSQHPGTRGMSHVYGRVIENPVLIAL